MQTIVADKVICADASDTEARWVAFADGLIVAVGSDDPPGKVTRVEGVLIPGLIDAHVHLTTTGLYDLGLDLRHARSIPELLDALGAHVVRVPDGWIIGGNFDPGRNEDARMPTRYELDAVAGERVVLVSRADGHSCTLNSKAIIEVGIAPGTEGVDLDDRGEPTGVLRAGANYETRRRFFGGLPEDVIERGQRRGCDIALSRGVTAVHEMAGGSYMGDKDFDVLVAKRSTYPIDVKPYLATTDIGRVLEAGLDCIGGDLFLDGSIGSRTAAMTSAYSDDPTEGVLYHSDEEIIGFFADATRAGLQAGVHAIGDAAIEQALRCMEEAIIASGPEGAVGARRLRHRIEHFECASDLQLDRAATLGVVASVQPMFDGYWGGLDGMYATRLGPRAAGMNPFAKMLSRGVVVAGGSDSTVTPLDPFLGMAAAVGHKTPGSGVDPDSALLMFTRWAAVAGRQETERGSIAPGLRADLVLVPADPRGEDPAQLSEMPVMTTWVGGSPVFRA